jgi:zinc transporter ZupT
MKQFFTELFQDETSSFSSKRFIGILAGLTLCVTLFANSFYDETIKPADTLVNAVAMLSFGCLGLASVDKIWAKRPRETHKEKTEESKEE